jgi:hypothetical protein
MSGVLVALLDTLLPGDGGEWPAAGALGLAVRCREVAALSGGGVAALAEVLAALPEGFAEQDAESRAAALRAVEAARPEAFERVLAAACGAYYTDARVQAVLARRTGYADRPPQPEGHILAPFDDALLVGVRARDKGWREAGA